MSFSLNDVSIAARVGAGLLVTAGAAGMSFVAVAMASGGADLSDDTGTAVGPATIYAFMFVGGLFNVVLLGDAATRVAGLALYAFAGWTYWQAGVEQAGFCLDAEAVRARRVRAADAGDDADRVRARRPRAAERRRRAWACAAWSSPILRLPLMLLVGVAAAIYLARRPPAAASRRLPRLLLLAAGLGVAAGGVVLARRGARGPLPVIALAVLAALVEELVLRGILQRSISTLRIRAAVISSVVGVVAALSLLRLAPQACRPEVCGPEGGRRRGDRGDDRRPRGGSRGGRGRVCVHGARRGGVAGARRSSSGSLLSRLSRSERLAYDDHDAVFPTFAYVTPECCASGRGGGVGNGSDRVMRCRQGRAGHDAVPAPRRLIRGHLFGRHRGGFREPGRRGRVGDRRWRRERAVGYCGHGRQQRRRGHGR